MSFQNRVWVTCVVAAALAGCPAEPGDVDAGGGEDAGGGVDAGGGTDAGNTPDGGGSGGVCAERFASQNAFGWACVTDADCADALCFHSEDFDNYCTKACDPDDTNSCPEGFECAAAGSGQVVDICVLSSGTRPLPGDGSVENGFPCNWDDDCASGDCAYSFSGDLALGRCAQGCETPGSDECGDCFACVEGGLSNRCERVGDGKVGDTCATDGDCSTGLCLALGDTSICSQACGGENGVECAAGTECTPTTGATTTYCIPDALIGAAGNGDPCSYGFECGTGLRCITAGTETTCQTARTQGQTCLTTTDCAEGLRCAPPATTGADRLCEPPGPIGAACSGSTAGQCATGLECKPFSREASFCTKSCASAGECGAGNTCAAPGMDTTLELYKGIDTVPDSELAYSDDIDLTNGNLFSAIRDLSVEAGTYFVRVKAFGSDAGGYTLAIRTAAGGSVAQATELAESPTDTNDNDDVDFAQLLIGVPVDVKGTLAASGDEDYFQFELTAPAVLTLKLTIGEGTRCLKTTQVATAGGGETCKFDAACSSSQCDLSVDACIQFCTDDASCGAGKKCRGTSVGNTCVAESRVGTTLRGEDCDYAWECADGLCESYGFSTFCTSACGPGAAVPTCPIGYECGEVGTDRSACLPEGDRSTPFNQSCTLQSDCVTGLNCLDGTCTKSCTADTECPGFDFPSNLPAGDVSCKACTSDADCGANGFCGRYTGTTNLVCVQYAQAATDCAAGFSYIEDFFSGTAYCVASQGSCNPSACVGAGTGLCAVPTREYRDTCDSAQQCRTEVCGGGFCTKACNVDADCGCTNNDFICAGNQCAGSGALLRSDVEPNNQPTQAPVLAPGTYRILGTLVATASGAGDIDLWKVTLPVGATLTATTRATCGSGSLDTFVAIANAQLEVVATDTAPNDTYGAVTFTADATENGELFLAVADESYLANDAAVQGSYVLEVTITVP